MTPRRPRGGRARGSRRPRAATSRAAPRVLATEPTPCRSCGGADRTRPLPSLPTSPDLPAGPCAVRRSDRTMDTGDTAWMLMSTALVMIMLPGPGPVLRRPRPPQERALDDHAQLLRPGPRQRRLGARRLHARVRADVNGWGLIGGLDFAMFNGVGLEPVDRLRDDHPVHAVRGVPADVRGHHPGPHHRRLRRAQALRLVRPLHAPLVDPRLLAARPLGLVGRRLAVQARRPRLRRRHRRPHQLRRLGPRRGPDHRPAPHERRRARSRTTCR